MEFIKLSYNGGKYDLVEDDSIRLNLISLHLFSDVRRDAIEYKKIALDQIDRSMSGNVTWIAKEYEFVTIGDCFNDERDGEIPVEVTMSVRQYVQLLDEWDEKVCKLQPQEVTIIYENDQYRIETKL